MTGPASGAVVERLQGQVPHWLVCAADALLFVPGDHGGRLLETGAPMERGFFFERRYDGGTAGVVRGVVATRMEHAARGRIGRRGRVAAQHNAQAFAFRIGDRDGGDASTGKWEKLGRDLGAIGT